MQLSLCATVLLGGSNAQPGGGRTHLVGGLRVWPDLGHELQRVLLLEAGGRDLRSDGGGWLWLWWENPREGVNAGQRFRAGRGSQGISRNDEVLNGAYVITPNAVSTSTTRFATYCNSSRLASQLRPGCIAANTSLTLCCSSMGVPY